MSIDILLQRVLVSAFSSSYGAQNVELGIIANNKAGGWMKFNGLETPAKGEKITASGSELTVPNNPVIPFIEGDGTGRDIWKAS